MFLMSYSRTVLNSFFDKLSPYSLLGKLLRSIMDLNTDRWVTVKILTKSFKNRLHFVGDNCILKVNRTNH